MAPLFNKSSLGNIETRLRRSLGLTGAVNLDLKPELQPVVIADDATRPGSSSQFRGRRWRNTRNFSIVAGFAGSYWLLCDEPAPSGPARLDVNEGGAIIDSIEVSVNAGAASTYALQIAIFASPLVLSPGIPIAVTNLDAFFVDPMRIDGEPAPFLTGTSGTQPANAARPIWEAQVHASPTSINLVKPQCGDIFLSRRSCLVIGNTTATTQNTTLYVNVSGRIF